MAADQLLRKERDRRFRLLFEDHPQPMCVMDAGCVRILAANRAAARLYGYAREDMRGLPVSELTGIEEAKRFADELARPDRPTSSVWRQHDRSGKQIDVEIACHEIRHEGYKAQLAVLMDITSRKQLEDMLRQSQKMEAVGMLAGGIAHDFNNLLTIITGYSQLMLNSLPLSDPNRYSAEQIIKAGERAGALTRQLLAFSRRQVLQPRVLDLNALVSSLAAMLRRLIGEDVDLRLALQPELGRVSADPGQIEQVLMNLAVNSRDAMPKGGALTIETADVTLGSEYTNLHGSMKPGNYVLLSVSDSGTGMDDATRARLFEPFFTTKGMGKGTGLGLSTVFGIVKQSAGGLDVLSELGRGTTVKVYLPRIEQPVAVELPGTRDAVPRGNETILLVEDEDMVRAFVRETLEKQGYRILEASGSAEARIISDAHKEPIQLLITDVVMPKISGRDLARELAAARPGMRILYMSGYTDSAVANSGILHREVEFLQKPFTVAALSEKVREVLEGKSVKAAD